MSVLGLSCAVVTEDIKCLKVQLSFHIGSLIGLCFFTFRSSDNLQIILSKILRDERYAEPPNHQWSKLVFQVGCLHLRYFETGTIRPKKWSILLLLGVEHPFAGWNRAPAGRLFPLYMCTCFMVGCCPLATTLWIFCGSSLCLRVRALWTSQTRSFFAGTLVFCPFLSGEKLVAWPDFLSDGAMGLSQL